MKVLKFGGTSVATSESIRKVVQIIVRGSVESKLTVVVSAMSGITDLLHSAGRMAAAKDKNYKSAIATIADRHISVVREILASKIQDTALQDVNQQMEELQTLLDGCFLLGELSQRSTDAILGFGELLSSAIVFEALKQEIPQVSYHDTRTLIKTDNRFGNAKVDFELSDRLLSEFFEKSDSHIVLLPGFIASSDDGHSTTLGRGGSDYTAAIVAAAINASVLEIWTDVNGMYTANPKIVLQAQPIAAISFQEAMELSHFGAKVLYPPTIQPVLNKNIPIVIKNTFEPEAPGTHIADNDVKSQGPVKGISHIDHISLITIEGSGIIGVAGFSKRLFEALSAEGINVIFITQASSEHSICIGIQTPDAALASSAINRAFTTEIALHSIVPCIVESDLCIVALVGENMKNHQGLSGKMFSTLGKNNVNVRAIAQGASERNISVVIAKRDVKKALNSLHERFFEDITKQLNLFVMGVGNVGEKFIDQIHSQSKFLKDNLKINIRVIAISNSRKMHFDEEGIALGSWKLSLDSGETANSALFVDKVKQLNLRNSIFVDITANENISTLYATFLKDNIAVVTCNKIACSSQFENYNNLKQLSRKYNAQFLFETNVGAGLPIIDTLKHLIASGDKINRIEAVLSGSLNFIFNNYNDQTNFAAVIKEAGVQGFTEPDPKIDLSGVDVARKILILIRESSYRMDIDEIDNVPFLPGECLATATLTDFFESVYKNEAHFKKLYNDAVKQNFRLKYVAEFADGKAKVGLQFIPQGHPFYNLEGKDNIVLFYTDRYCDQPLLIKGAGAGAAVTASGIFADVIRIANG